MFGATSENEGRIRIKICGITNAADAVAAIDYGADALGFNFYPRSKRYIDIEAAREWIEKLPPQICRIAVVVDPTWAEARRIGEMPFIDALQLHGNESPEFCRRLSETGIRFAKALPVSDPESLVDLPSFSTDTFVLDSAFRGEFGGSGKTFPWHWARGFTRSHPTFKVILAGGLAAENVAQAVSEVRPFGVDVTSGVESRPGRKDHALLQAFIEAARDRRTV